MRFLTPYVIFQEHSDAFPCVITVFITAVTLCPVFTPPVLRKVVRSAVPISDFSILFHNEGTIHRGKA